MKSILNCTGHALNIPDIVKSSGIFLFDGDGKKYMDLESGVWCTSIGHNNPEVNEKILDIRGMGVNQINFWRS